MFRNHMTRDHVALSGPNGGECLQLVDASVTFFFSRAVFAIWMTCGWRYHACFSVRPVPPTDPPPSRPIGRIDGPIGWTDRPVRLADRPNNRPAARPTSPRPTEPMDRPDRPAERPTTDQRDRQTELNDRPARPTGAPRGVGELVCPLLVEWHKTRSA